MAEAAGAEAGALLEKRPLDVEALARLESLDLRSSGLSSLSSEALGSLAALRRLDLGGLRLEPWPRGLPGLLPKLEVLFASGMGLAEVPPALAESRSLRMLGLKDNELASLDGERLPPNLVWLIAAGNPLRELPRLDRLQHVRKLMLSHNRLTRSALEPLAGIAELEMLRVASNCLEDVPKELLRHRRLAWVAVGGNPFAEEAMERRLAGAPAVVDFAEVETSERLGSGAGATVYRGLWRGRSVAVKIWEAEQFSDGTARGEWAVNRVAAAPGHEALLAVHGAFERPRPGMLLELLAGASAAASAPSFATVTRDALPGRSGGRGPRFTATAALHVAAAVASGASYLHSRGVVHGDIYLHNTLVVPKPALGSADADAPVDVEDARLSDFGAAAVVPDSALGEGLKRLEVRSFGWLLQDLVEIVSDASASSASQPAAAKDETEEVLALLRTLRERCANEDVDELPTFAELSAALAEARRARGGGSGGGDGEAGQKRPRVDGEGGGGRGPAGGSGGRAGGRPLLGAL